MAKVEGVKDKPISVFKPTEVEVSKKVGNYQGHPVQKATNKGATAETKVHSTKTQYRKIETQKTKNIFQAIVNGAAGSVKKGIKVIENTAQKSLETIKDAANNVGQGIKKAREMVSNMANKSVKHNEQIAKVKLDKTDKISTSWKTQEVNVTDGKYNWKAKYDIRILNQTIEVRVKVKLEPQKGVSDEKLKELKKEWEKAGEKWSGKFKLVDRKDLSNKYDVKVKLEFVDSEEHLEVKVHHTETYRRSNLSNWDTKDDKNAISHELGHQLGLKDEYPDKDNSPSRKVTDNSSIMYSDSGNVKKEHYLPFADWLSKETGKDFEVK